jgi:uncharacterized repeat protein (TIGR01451 family)
MTRVVTFLFILLTLVSGTAATISIVVQDGASEGFNDPTPAVPVGGNPGLTVGQQRLNVFQRAADIWGARLSSTVPILVGAKFDPLSCSQSSGVLGSCGAHSYFRDFAGAPRPGTYYPVALANALAGVDLDPGAVDMDATFNSDVGAANCLTSLQWYYGLDEKAPSGTIDLLDVVLHEFCHGLGFISTVSLSTGGRLNGFNDTFMLNLEDHSSGKLYPNMTDAERLAASINTGNLHWVGTNVVAASTLLSSGRNSAGHVLMYAPNPSEAGSSVSHFDTSLTPNELMEPFINSTEDRRLTTELLRDVGWTVLPAVTTGGQTIIAESCLNGAIDPNETVTVNFNLRNFGFSDTANLTATLLVTNGVANPSAPQSYGLLSVAGAAVGRSFTFTATGECGRVITPTLKLQDGTNSFGQVQFEFRLGSLLEFGRTNAISVPNSGAAATYPATIIVSNFAGGVRGLSVRLNNINHPNPDDLDILLVGPQGQSVLLMSDSGGSADLSNVTLTFSDAAAGLLPDSSQINPGTYKPSNYGTGDAFPAPAPGGTYGTNLSVFDGSNPNGTWQLFVVDDRSANSGNISGGWTLILPSCCTAPGAPPQLQFNQTLANYVENALPASIAPEAIVLDNDSLHFNGGSLAVAIVTNATPADFLSVLNTGSALGQIGVTGSIVTFSGLVIGSWTGGTNASNPLLVTFTSTNATIEAVQALCRAVGFASTSENPSTNSRAVRFTINDGNAGNVSATKSLQVIAVNDSPSISAIADRTILEDNSTNPISFIVGDPDTPAGSLVVSANASNPALISGFSFSGNGSNRSLTITPVPNANGTSVITVLVSDGQATNATSFLLTVSPLNDAPTLDPLTNRVIFANSEPLLVPLTGISAGPSNETQALSVTAFSDSVSPLAAPVIVYLSADATGLLTLSPFPDASGTSVVSVVVTDNGGVANGGQNAVTNSFQVIVLPVADIAVAGSAIYDGTNLHLTVAVTNAGPQAASSVVVSNILPLNASLTSLAAGIAACVTNNGILICSLESLAPHSSATIGMDLSVPVTGWVTNLVSVGALEFDPNLTNNFSLITLLVTDDTDGDGLPDWWENLHGTNPNVADGDLDPDGDGLSNLQEYLAGTDPNDPSSALRLALEYNNAQVTLLFTALPDRTYSILYSTDLQSGIWTKLFDAPPSATNQVRVSDPGFSTDAIRFYRVVTPQQP